MVTMVYNTNRQLQIIALKDLHFTLSDQLFLNVLLMEIRNKQLLTVRKRKYGKRTKNPKRDTELGEQHWTIRRRHQIVATKKTV